LLDSSQLAYDFDLQQVALVAIGPEANEAVGDLASGAGPVHLVLPRGRGLVWGWVGRKNGFTSEDLDALASDSQDAARRRRDPDTRLAIGEPGHGLAGWRLSHHQARAALAVAQLGPDPVVRYADVAMVATVLKDELLVNSLQRLYLDPLDGVGDGGEELRRTLRAYFAADRNVSAAAAAVGVTRQAVSRRLRSAEERLGRPIGALGADLEIALRLEALAG
jgi:sugar diacid utilization regulator